MNSRQLQYAVLLSEQRSFSQVADRLGISQPALSKQILALENELGVRLFDRSSNPLTLTAAGESFVKDARELLFRQEQLVRSMDDFKSGDKGQINIGVSPFRCMYLMPEVTRRLRERFPGLRVVLSETDSARLHKGAADGLYDFAIINLPVDEALLDVIPLEPERLVLAVPEELLSLMPKTEECGGDQLPTVDLKDCGALPFVVLSERQELRRLFDGMCAASGLRPEIVSEVVGITTAWAMARAGVGATVLPLQFLRGSSVEGGLSFFALKQEASTRRPAIVTRKGQHISGYARYAIELLRGMA